MEYLKQEEKLEILQRIFARNNPVLSPRRKARNAEAWCRAARLVIDEPVNVRWAGQYLCSGSSGIELPDRQSSYGRSGEYPGSLRRHARDAGGVGAAVLKVLARFIVERYSPFFPVVGSDKEMAAQAAHAWACAHVDFVQAVLAGDTAAAVSYMELSVEVELNDDLA